MSLESGNYITDLVPSNPPGTDPKSQGDNHLQLIKKCVQQSFPNTSGPVNITTNRLILGNSVTQTQNLSIKSNGDNTFTIERQSGEDLIVIDVNGVVGFPLGTTIIQSTGDTVHRAIRFDDGTQIVYLNRSGTDVAIDSVYGSLFIGTYSWTFLLPFVAGSTPNVQCSLFAAASQAGWGGVAAPASNSAVNLRGWDIASRPLGTTVSIGGLAVGRWK